MSKRPRLEVPPDDRPAPGEWAAGGWVWSPDAGDWIAGGSEVPTHAPLSLPPASTPTPEPETDGTV